MFDFTVHKSSCGKVNKIVNLKVRANPMFQFQLFAKDQQSNAARVLSWYADTANITFGSIRMYAIFSSNL